MAKRRPDPRDKFGARDARIASAVRAAGGYVVPSDDLRPRTLEAARERTQMQQTCWRLASVALALLTLLVGGVASRRSDRGLSPEAHWEELQAEAYEKAAIPGVGQAWALVDAFTQWRARQAEMLRDGADQQVEKTQ